MVEQLQYITQGTTTSDHIKMCREACEAGVKWVQLRLKNVTSKEYALAAKACRIITNDYDARLIINDRLDIAIQCQADGVHLGLNDLSTGAAREQVPEGFIIGGTANTFEHIQSHYENGVDYVGVGPYRFTKTKDKLSPILGIEGYQAILQKMHYAEMDIPLIAIGGILNEDVPTLIHSGVHGIAVSGLITSTKDKTTTVKELYNSLNYATA